MKVNVAGAGAGKTTRMADLITKFDVPEGKIVFCIAFTNAAEKNIENKVTSKLGSIPSNIKISTIHSFLYQELIKPYYYLLYGVQFEILSAINLPDNVIYRRKKLSELEKCHILHYTAIPEKAKWVVYRKSGEKKNEKDIRERIIKFFSSYCAAVFVDEAQDINRDMLIILEAIEKTGVEVILYGDPKQDIKGFGCFQNIIDNSLSVNYISECYRCPQIHLDISNKLASSNEQQIAASRNSKGSIEIVFESEIENIPKFILDGDYDLEYISKKCSRFATHKRQGDNRQFETLRYEVYRAMTDKWSECKSNEEISRSAFFVTEKMLEEYDGHNEAIIIKKWVDRKAFCRLENNQYVQMIQAFGCGNSGDSCVPIVNSIESIKGLEANRCLFILTGDLGPYLLGKELKENKMKHLAYVALTRSLKHLTILVTKEVEIKYSKTEILNFFNY